MSAAAGSMLLDVADDPDRADLIDWLGRAIRKARESRGVSRRALAEKSGVSVPMIVKAESGSNLSVAVLAALGRALGFEDLTSFVAELEDRPTPGASADAHNLAARMLDEAADKLRKL